jgi:hypothetical protein
MWRSFAWLFLTGAFGLVGVLTNNRSSAQFVDISPRGIHVRAPFVSVDVYRYGGVSVRAPFAAVDVPGRPYRYYERPIAVHQPAIPTAQELSRLNDDRLGRILRSAAARLHDDLDRFDTGDKWQRYLRVSNEGPEGLANDLARFRRIESDSQFGMISELPAFRATRGVLSELASRSGRSPSVWGTKPEELPLPPPARPGAERSLLPTR